MVRMAQSKVSKPPIKKEAAMALGQLAGQTARQATLDACSKAGLTVTKVAETIVKALDATQVKAQYDSEVGIWAISEELTDHPTRLKAVEASITILDLKPSLKAEISVLDQMSDEQIDAKLKAIMGSGK